MIRLGAILILTALAPALPVEAGAPAATRKLVGSCRFPRTCADYDDAREDAKRRCEAFGAVWKNEPCPSANLVATCINAWSEGRSLTRFYAPTTQAEAKALCDSGKGQLR
jgi:hypothetical protein